jgi:hypothetical protein
MSNILRVTPVVCAAAFLLAGCNLEKGSPTGPDSPILKVAGSDVTPAKQSPGSTTPGSTENRTPDPADGERLPLPDMSGVVQQVASQYPDALRSSCQDHGGSWEFLDRVVDELRRHDTRWGYNWKRGNVGDPSKDVVDYHWGAGGDENSTDVYIIDVVIGHCGDNPSPGWGDVTGATFGGGSIGRWTARGRF